MASDSSSPICFRLLFSLRTAQPRFLFWPVLVCALGLEFSACSQPTSEFPAEQFDELHALTKPKVEEEQWRAIPWMTSLWEARRRAAAEGKPILLWEMDGHPLGST